MLRRSVLHFFGGFLKVQQTPNPDCISFTIPDHFDKDVLLVPEGVTCEASGMGYCDIHPVARALFHNYMKEISAVFISPRSVSITKYYHSDWNSGAFDASQDNYTGITITESVNAFLSEIVRDYDEPIAPDPDYLLISSLADNDLTVNEATDSDLAQCVKDLLRLQIRPMIMQDGGDIRLLNVNEKSGVVSLHMLGACKTCPSSQNTLKNGIERVLKHFLPEITEVVEVKNPVVTVTKEYTVPTEPPLASASSTNPPSTTAIESPVAMKIRKTFEVSEDDFQPVHKNEASVYREIARNDDARVRKLMEASKRRDALEKEKFEAMQRAMRKAEEREKKSPAAVSDNEAASVPAAVASSHQKVSRPSDAARTRSGGRLLSFEELMEPDGD